jgi:hypothetical protein
VIIFHIGLIGLGWCKTEIGRSGLFAPQQGGEKEHEKENETDFGDRSGGAGNDPKAKDARDQGDEDKSEGVAEHGKKLAGW